MRVHTHAHMLTVKTVTMSTEGTSLVFDMGYPADHCWILYTHTRQESGELANLVECSYWGSKKPQAQDKSSTKSSRGNSPGWATGKGRWLPTHIGMQLNPVNVSQGRI